MTEEGDHNAENEDVNLPDAEFADLESLELTSELQKAKEENQETREKYIRLLAEFENFKKRTLKERSDLMKYQGEKVFTDMLGILDDLERALQYTEADPEKIKEGLQLIHKSFLDILSRWSVRGESGLDQPFDPAKHSALSKIPVADKKPGTIVNELKKAYFYKDKLIRPAEVVVAEEPAAEEENKG